MLWPQLISNDFGWNRSKYVSLISYDQSIPYLNNFLYIFSILVNVLQSQILPCMEHVLQVNLCQKLFFLENMGRTCCVQKLFWMSKTISVHNMFSPCSELWIFMYWTCNSMNNLLSYCGLVDAKIRASDKDLPVILNSERTDETNVCVQRYNLFFIN